MWTGEAVKLKEETQAKKEEPAPKVEQTQAKKEEPAPKVEQTQISDTPDAKVSLLMIQ